MYTSDPKTHKNFCNKELNDSVKNDAKLAEKFDSEQLEQIENKETPDGYVWHHNEEVGKMQLVDADLQQKNGHIGGRAIWGQKINQ